MKYYLLLISFLLLAGHIKADNEASAAKSKMIYVSSFDEAKGVSRRTGKPIFINFSAKWAAPCQGMDEFVFSDEEFAKYMDKNFVNYFVDVKTPEGQELAKAYDVRSYAYYAVVDCNGQMIQPIGSGAALPQFKEFVSISLSPKTSYVANKKKYESGKYSKKDLRNYIRSIRVAGIGKDFHRLINEYMGMLAPKEYLDKENWELLYYERDRNNSFFRYLVENKPQFVKKFGAESVNSFIGRAFASDVLGYATGDADMEALNAIGEELEKVGLPDTAKVNVVYNIARLRATRSYVDLFKYMDEYGRYLEGETMLRPTIERSFNFKSLTGDDEKALVDYLQRAIKRETPNNAKHLQNLLTYIQEPAKGIVFEEGRLADILAKAKSENKLVFVDCYTSWCGPCRSLATNVFTRDDVGKCYNDRCVNIKIDMEKGEGPSLAEKYGVSAFPTMLFLDHEGNVLDRIIGYKDADALIEAAEKIAVK